MPAPKSSAERLPVPAELVARKIYLIRGHGVMIDSDLAELHQVETKVLNRQLKRTPHRFPEDFMFQLTTEEAKNLRCQIWHLKFRFGGRGYLMLSAVLRSDRAVRMSVLIVRAFVKLREVLATHKALAQKIEQLAATQKDHAALFDIVIQNIQQLDRKFTSRSGASNLRAAANLA